MDQLTETPNNKMAVDVAESENFERPYAFVGRFEISGITERNNRYQLTSVGQSKSVFPLDGNGEMILIQKIK